MLTNHRLATCVWPLRNRDPPAKICSPHCALICKAYQHLLTKLLLTGTCIRFRLQLVHVFGTSNAHGRLHMSPQYNIMRSRSGDLTGPGRAINMYIRTHLTFTGPGRCLQNVPVVHRPLEATCLIAVTSGMLFRMGIRILTAFVELPNPSGLATPWGLLSLK
jgi:hypothetical protein